MSDSGYRFDPRRAKSKMKGCLWVFISLCVLCSVVVALFPVRIPKFEPGTRYDRNSVGALVKLEVFLDLNCPDSLTAWSELKKVATHYNKDKLDLVVHHFPLPYHDHAFLCSQGFFLIRDFINYKAALTYMEEVLKSWYSFSSSSTENLTKEAVKRKLADLAAKVTTIHREQFLQYLDQYRSPVVEEWKYSARRGVAGTPWYFVNGVDLAVNNAMTFSDLQKVLNSLI